MGDGAADAFARQAGMSFGDAYDCLYGEAGSKPRCPICGKKCSGSGGITAHLIAVHTSERLKNRVADAMAQIAKSAD